MTERGVALGLARRDGLGGAGAVAAMRPFFFITDNHWQGFFAAGPATSARFGDRVGQMRRRSVQGRRHVR